MNKRIISIAAAAAIAGFAGFWLSQKTPTTPATPAVTVDKPQQTYISHKNIVLGKKPVRPEFSMPDRYNKVRNIKEWHGKIILLNFWATWCPPCRKEMPAFIELQKKYGSQGFQIVGVALDETKMVNDFADKIGVNYPLLVGSLNASELARVYGNTGGLPYSVFINRQGQLVAAKRGELTKEQAETIIQKLLKQKNNPEN